MDDLLYKLFKYTLVSASNLFCGLSSGINGVSSVSLSPIGSYQKYFLMRFTVFLDLVNHRTPDKPTVPHIISVNFEYND